ncbi:leucine-rich repeat and transmembrane domain-containing protein 2 [Tachysurus ichikawai]
MNVKVPAVLLTLLSLTRELEGCPSICTCNITHTDCSSSSSSDLPLSFDLISSLITSNTTTFNLSRNDIMLIDPGAFANLSNLLQLDLSRNQLLTLHPFTFYPLSSLEFLDLSSNFLEDLAVDLFSELSNLRELILRDNRLKNVNSKPFQRLAELQHLDLSLNSLVSVSLELLDGLQGLEWLSLAGNKLRTIPRAVMEPLTVLNRLLLEGNRWNCSCSLVPFRHWVEWMLYRGGHVDSIECSLPTILQGRDLRIIPMDMFKHCSQPPSSDRRTPPSECLILSTDSTAACMEQRPNAVNLRWATTTLVLARLVCGVVWLMMIVVAMYGCVYAMLAAKYKQEKLKRTLLLCRLPLMEVKEPEVKQEKDEENENDMDPDFEEGAKAREHTEWIVLPPEACV